MPEENQSAPVPATPETKSSVLDKNVPNPLAKNPNVHTHKVFASVGLILIGVIVILGVLAFIYRNQVADMFDTKTAEENTTTTKVSTPSATTATTPEAKTETKDETANWLVYKNTKAKFQIMYPPEWKLEYLDKWAGMRMQLYQVKRVILILFGETG